MTPILLLTILAGSAIASPGRAAPQAREAPAVPEASRTAPGKAPRPGGPAHPGDLSMEAWRIGSWISDDWIGEGEERHRARIDDRWELGGHVLVGDSSKVYPDGRRERYLESNLVFHGTSGRTAAYLFFDDGLLADAVWTADGDGVHRLDCDLAWPDGRSAAVRDVFVRVGEDAYYWAMYWVRDGELDEEPSFTTWMERIGEP